MNEACQGVERKAYKDIRELFTIDLDTAPEQEVRVLAAQILFAANADSLPTGPNVETAAQTVLREAAVDAYLAYLNDGLYDARELDCASQPTPSATPSASTTAAPTPTASASPGAPGGEGGEGGGLPVTGADTATVAGIGSVLLLLGGAGYLIGRRRRSRFVA
ncbi:LPXTG cell wall anchor domain-containing protein [Micromonospora sp. NPDC049049]|uniref:LPXTG cell wall anchor domain-containing protein n=1 Tax=Micromonospora sp. NPDC049049 TaxID=3155495 RepID=UPI0033EC5434